MDDLTEKLLTQMQNGNRLLADAAQKRGYKIHPKALAMREAGITAGDVVQRLAAYFTSDDTDRIMRRVRHWSLLGAIPVSDGTVHKGQGRARVFDETAVQLAAVGMCLSIWQMPIGVLKAILRELHANITADCRDAELWAAAASGALIYLIHEPGKGVRLLPHDEVRQCVPMDGSALIVPLHNVLRGVSTRHR